MPRLAGCRSAVNRVLKNLHLSERGDVRLIPTVADAPALQKHDKVDGALLQAANLRNQSLPINRLPNELLIGIFLLVGSRCKGKNSPAWIKLMLVCRYWRDVVLATPGVWRSIDIGLNTDWIDLALTRSDPATLDIYMHSKYVSRELFPLIYPHVHRIRRLVSHNRIDAKWSSDLRNLFDQNMPALENLILAMKSDPNPNPEPAQPAYIDIQLSFLQFPRLQMLSLSHVVMPRDPLLFSKLHTLVLENCECDCSLEQFIGILSSCSMLRKLYLLSFLNHLTGNWPTHPNSQKAPISLPRIAAVVLRHHLPRHSSRFLAHLLLPANIYLIVHANMPIEGPDSNNCLLDAIPHNRATDLPVLRAVTKAELFALQDQYFLRGAILRSGKKYPFELRYRPVFDNPWAVGPGRRDLLLRGLADLVSVFQPSSLRYLSIRGVSVAVAQAKWREVLDAFPLLKVLRVSDNGPMVGLVGALQSSSSSESTAEHDLADRPPLLPCPKLLILALELQCDMYGPFLDMFLDCVRDRAEKGSRLRKLELRSNSPADAITEDWTAFVQGLEGLVPEVRYLPPDPGELLATFFNPLQPDL